MRRVVAMLAVLALACFVCVSVSEAKGKGGGKAKSPEQAFKAMDKDGNGEVSEAEYLESAKTQKNFDEAKAKKAFAKMAPDGKLTLKAYQDFVEQQKKKAAEKKKK